MRSILIITTHNKHTQMYMHTHITHVHTHTHICPRTLPSDNRLSAAVGTRASVNSRLSFSGVARDSMEVG